MLAIHWSPVKNTGKILKNGITKSRTGLYCFPLTGHRELDKGWIKGFGVGYRQRVEYNGFVFRIEQQDMPAYFGYFPGATTGDVFKKNITNIDNLTAMYRNSVLYKIGESLFESDYEKYFIDGAKEDVDDGIVDINSYLNDLGDMMELFAASQIVLSNSISPKRIMKIVTPRNEFGRILHKTKKNKQYKENNF